ncbi:MAG: 4-hydroxybenzoate octaprenyltransferase [Pseudomonadota bacterium]|nr:4-hydroxybenzoate octaprenyltransferase [Pseudomonadota bacterium]
MRMTIHNDIAPAAWLHRIVPPVLRPYARLMRLDRPTGTWLLLLPCWWGVALASSKLPDLGLMLLFALGALIMRGAGCTANDIYDRKLDAMVERTKGRPLPSGEVKLWQAALFLLLLLLLGFGILLLFNRLTILIGVFSLVLVFSYPLMKRVTWWPQLFLGFTFNWGALMGWSAVRDNGASFLPFLLYVAGIFWTLGYDTIYAHQDKRDDEIAGIMSTARLFGDHSRRWVALFYAVALLVLALMGTLAGLGQGFYALLILAAAFAAVQVLAWQPDDPLDCLRRFGANRDFGLVILLAIVLGKIQ